MKKLILFSLLVLMAKLSYSQVYAPSSESWGNIGLVEGIVIDYKIIPAATEVRNGCNKRWFNVTINMKNNLNKEIKVEKVILNFYFNDNCVEKASVNIMNVQRAFSNFKEIYMAPGKSQTGNSTIILPIEITNPKELNPQWEVVIKAKGGFSGLEINSNINNNDQDIISSTEPNNTNRENNSVDQENNKNDIDIICVGDQSKTFDEHYYYYCLHFDEGATWACGAPLSELDEKFPIGHIFICPKCGTKSKVCERN